MGEVQSRVKVAGARGIVVHGLVLVKECAGVLQYVVGVVIKHQYPNNIFRIHVLTPLMVLGRLVTSLWSASLQL